MLQTSRVSIRALAFFLAALSVLYRLAENLIGRGVASQPVLNRFFG